MHMGVVESVRDVALDGTKTSIGAGAVVGGAVEEEAVTHQRGIEITVKLDSGRMIAVTQAADQPLTACACWPAAASPG